MRGYIPPQNDDEKLFCKKIESLFEKSQYSDRMLFTAFLDEREQQLAKAVANRYSDISYQLWGGYNNAARLMFCINSDNAEPTDYPIDAVTAVCKGADKLSHRDFLGSLMGLNIKRECIGDIITQNQNSAVIFLNNKISPLVISELTSVGRFSANVEYYRGEFDFCDEQQPQQQSATVASLRLDNILSAMLNISRNDAARLIKSDSVTVNHIHTDSLHFEMCDDDTVTVKGYGKFKIVQIGGQSRKNRTFINYIKY